MKVKATELFKSYRNASLKLPRSDFRKLQAGKTVEISKGKYDEYKHIYEVVEKDVGVKNGN